jgi:hypothetical protein
VRREESPKDLSGIQRANDGRCCTAVGRKWRAEKKEESLEGLAVEDAAFGDLETESLVGVLGEEVIELRVGGHFGAALGASPVFGGREERGADADAAVSFDDVPAFDVADGVGWVAAVGVRAEAGLEKAE